jgi:predicted permease
LVAIQAGLGVIVLVGAALLTRSFVALRSVEVGFDARETWVMSIPAPLSTLEEIATKVRDIPGIAAAAVAYDHPLDRSWGDAFLIEGVPFSGLDAVPLASLRPFGEDYFAAAGIEVQSGRLPDGVDMSGSVGYAVINETLAETYFPAGDAVGSRIILPTARSMSGGDGMFEILGIVSDVRFLGPDQTPGPALYVPLSHFQADATTLLVRPERAEIDVLTAVRRIVGETAPGLAVQRPQQLQNVLDNLLARPRFNMMLVISFGIMGLMLCGLGAYVLMARVVVARFREIGIRMALGAQRTDLARSVMWSALRPMLVGGVVGIAASLGLVRLVRSLLFEISPGDPISFFLSPAFVVAVGLVAALVPTIRALSVDPVSTLRSD